MRDDQHCKRLGLICCQRIASTTRISPLQMANFSGNDLVQAEDGNNEVLTIGKRLHISKVGSRCANRIVRRSVLLPVL